MTQGRPAEPGSTRMGWPTGRLTNDGDPLHLSGAAGKGARESPWAKVAQDLPCALARRVSPAIWPTSRAAAVPLVRGRPTALIYSGHFTFEPHAHEDH